MLKIKYYLLLLSFSFSYSQSLIKGEVKDLNNESIRSASIILKDNNGKIITYTYTDELGKYELKTDKLGQFILTASSMGFEQKSIDVTIENNNENKTIDFILNTKITEIKEIIIQSKRPFTIKNDSIFFNADFYKQGNEQTVEDLLKKYLG